MPKTPTVHIKRTSTGKYQYVFEKAKINGKRIRCYKTFSTEKQAIIEGNRAYAQYYSTGTETYRRISYADFAEEWIKNDIEGFLSDSTAESYRKRLKNQIIPFIGDKLITSITPSDLNNLLLQLYNKGISRNSLTSAKALITKSFRFAQENRYISTNPAVSLKLPNGRKKPLISARSGQHHYLDDYTMNRIFQELKDNPTYTLIIKVGYLTGMRHGEIFGLFWEDIDYANRTISINKQLQFKKDLTRSPSEISMLNGTSYKGKGYWYYKPPKYDSNRVIAVNDELLKLLREYRENQLKHSATRRVKVYVDEYPVKGFTESKVLEKGQKGIEVEPVFTKDDGGFLNSNICQHISSRIHSSVTQKFDMHSLRTTHSTILQNQGFNLRYISKRLGHIDIKTTENDYYVLTKDTIRKEDEKLNSFFESIEEKGLLEGKSYLSMDDVVQQDDNQLDKDTQKKMDDTDW